MSEPFAKINVGRLSRQRHEVPLDAETSILLLEEELGRLRLLVGWQMKRHVVLRVSRLIGESSG